MKGKMKMKKILLTLLATVFAIPMFASKIKEATQDAQPVFHSWVSMWGETGTEGVAPKDGPFAELPDVIKIPGVNALSLGFMGWDEEGTLFTGWRFEKTDPSQKLGPFNQWLTRPADKSNVVDPWYWLWSYYAHENTKIDYYMGAGGWSFGGGDVDGNTGPDIWKTLPKMAPGNREQLASNIANFIEKTSPVFEHWTWWNNTPLEALSERVHLAGINLDLETVDTEKGGPGEFTPEMLDAVADLVEHLKKKGVDKIIATVMVKDYKDNMIELLRNHFDNFYEIHVMAYDMGKKEWQKEGYKAEMNAFAEALSEGGKIDLKKVKAKMVIGLSACEQYTDKDELVDGKKIVEPIDQLKGKAQWIVDNGFKGTFLWSVGQTYTVKDRHPGYTETDIVKAIIRAMHK